MQFVITAFDGRDGAAPERRKAARPEHLKLAAKLKEAGHLIAGGAILDDDGDMIGSTMYLDFESREQLQEWLDRDPYVTGDVWKEIDIKPIRLAISF